MNWDQIENSWMAMARRIRSGKPSNEVPNADAQHPSAMQPSGDMAEVATDWSERTVKTAVSASRLIA